MSAPICFVDCETDGVHPDRRPWEIAIIRREPDGTETTWASFVSLDLSTSDPFGLRVGRFYDRHPHGRWISGNRNPHETRQPDPFYGDPDEPAPYATDYVIPRVAADWVARMTHGAHLVGAVPNFDAEVFDRLLRAYRLAPSWHHHLIDVEALAVGWLAHKAKTIREQQPEIRLEPWPQLPWKSDELGAALGVEPTPEDERHTALGDARWAMRIYDAVMAS